MLGRIYIYASEQSQQTVLWTRIQLAVYPDPNPGKPTIARKKKRKRKKFHMRFGVYKKKDENETYHFISLKKINFVKTVHLFDLFTKNLDLNPDLPNNFGLEPDIR
jgi:hypothetical protein